MCYIFFSNANFLFNIIEFIKKSYIAAEILSSISKIKFIDKIKFPKIAMDKILKLLLYILYYSKLLIWQFIIHKYSKWLHFNVIKPLLKILPNFRSYQCFFFQSNNSIVREYKYL